MDENGNLEPSDFQPDIYQSQGPKTAEAALLTARILWFALTVSQGMYLFVGRMLMQNRGPIANGLPSDAPVQPMSFMETVQTPMGMVFSLAAVSFLGLSFFIPNLMDRSGAPQSAGGAPRTSLQNRLQAKLVRFIIGAALNESVAIMGLAGGFIALKNADFGSILIYVSIAAMLTRFPSAEFFAEPTGPRFG